MSALVIFTLIMLHKKDLIYTLTPFFLIHFFVRLLILNQGLELSLFIVLTESFVMIAQGFLLLYLSQAFHVVFNIKNNRFKGNLLFIVNTLILALFSTIITVALYRALSITDLYLSHHIVQSFSKEFFGIALVLPLLYLSYRFDKRFALPEYKLIKHTLFFLAYLSLIIVILLFEPFSFNQHGYFFSVLFVLVAFLFSYRIILFYSILSLYLGAFLFIQSDWPIIQHTEQTLSFIIFIFIAVMLAIIIRRVREEQFGQQRDNKMMNQELDDLLDFVYELLSLSKSLIKDDQNDDLLYMDKTFDVAIRLFQDVDKAFYIVEDHNDYTVHSRYNYNHDNDIPFLHESLNIFLEESIHLLRLNSIKDTLKTRYGEDVLHFHPSTTIQSRIFMSFNISAKKRMILCIDQYKERATYHVNRYHQFLALIDQLYKKHDLNQSAQVLKDDIILSFVRTLDLYDAYTKGHSEDVAKISQTLAKALDLDEDAVKNIYYAGLLHDIGKVGVDSHVINKKGKLNKDEYEAVKKHVMFGYNVMADEEALKPIAEIVKHHHEWWDGSGYPAGLKETDIPLGAQILSVADALSTMATDRPYRTHLDKQTILNELKKYAGTQFSPTITPIMIQFIQEGFLERHYKKEF